MPDSDDAARLDDEYHEYLWGESSPRSFARKAKFAGTKENSRSVVTIETDVAFDVSAFVSR